MADDKKLAVDEAERIAQYEAVKRSVRDGVQTEIARHAVDDRDETRLAALGERMHDRAVNEVTATEREVAVTRVAARGSQILDYVFYLIYGIIGLEILFDLLGARKANTIREVVDALAAPLLAPFRNLLSDPAAGRFQFRISYLVALVIYVLLHFAVKGLFRLVAHRKTAV